MRLLVAKRLLLTTLTLAGAGAVSAPVALPTRTAATPERAAPAVFAPGGLEPHNFYFSRAAYSSGGYGRWGRGRSWETDYPKADRQFLAVLRRLTGVDAYALENAVRLDDPNLRRFPFLYAVEVGNMSLSDAEVKGLREYLLAGGFLVADDFWGSYEWRSFEEQMRRVLPEYPIVDLPRDHPVFSAFYDIREIIQVPNVYQGSRGGPTHERDGYEPFCRGILDDRGRLLVVINWNTDLGDGWEWAEQPSYPLKFSSYAYRIGANFIVYSMSH